MSSPPPYDNITGISRTVMKDNAQETVYDVNDSNRVASGNFGAVVGNAGSNVVPVYSDGANWRIG